MTSEPQYLVWSNKQNAWWGPYGRYYTQDVWEAHRYTLQAAEHACTLRTQQPGKPSTEIAVKAPECGRPPFTVEELRFLPQQMRMLIDDLNRMDWRERAREEAGAR